MVNIVSSSYTVKRVQGRSPGKGSTFWDHHTVNTVPQFWRDLQSTPWSQTVELWEFLSSSNNYVAINIWQLTHSCKSSLAKWEIKVFWNLEWGGGLWLNPGEADTLNISNSEGLVPVSMACYLAFWKTGLLQPENYGTLGWADVLKVMLIQISACSRVTVR